MSLGGPCALLLGWSDQAFLLTSWCHLQDAEFQDPPHPVLSFNLTLHFTGLSGKRQHMQGCCDFLRGWTAWEDEVVTGIRPTTPDMPIRNTHLQDVHSVHCPLQRIPAPQHHGACGLTTWAISLTPRLQNFVRPLTVKRHT